MKRVDLLKELKRIARTTGAELVFVRHGYDHDQYRARGRLIVIPRHREINERTAAAILADAQQVMKGASQ